MITGCSPDCCKSVLRKDFHPAKTDRKPPSCQARKAEAIAQASHVSNLGCTHNGELSCTRVSSVDEALQEIVAKGEPLGLGIDAPMWWSSGVGGGRKSDEAAAYFGGVRCALSLVAPGVVDPGTTEGHGQKSRQAASPRGREEQVERRLARFSTSRAPQVWKTLKTATSPLGKLPLIAGCWTHRIRELQVKRLLSLQLWAGPSQSGWSTFMFRLGSVSLCV